MYLLFAFGVRGNLLWWICGYVSNRNFRVVLSGGEYSQSRDFHLGTAQRGVLSPCFVQYSNVSVAHLPPSHSGNYYYMVC